jgi:hypothetical protein
VISGEEFERRIRMASQLRAFILGLKKAGIQAFERGETRYRPKPALRSDFEYWRKLAEEKGIKIDSVDGDVH